MKKLFLKAAIIKATVTEANLHYVGSITIDETLVEKSGLKAGENVLVVDHTNGARLETYVIIGAKGSGVICMNGAAAHLIKEGDVITVMSFEWALKKSLSAFIFVDRENQYEKTSSYLPLDVEIGHGKTEN